MAAVGDTVIQILPGTDQYEQGAAPILVGFVFAAGSGAGLWDVRWSNGAVVTDQSDATLRTLGALTTTNVGKRARVIPSVNSVSPGRIGLVVLRDDAGVHILRMPNGTLYSLTTANIEILNT